MPGRFFRCYGYLKRAAAAMNAQAGRLPAWKTTAIAHAAADLIAGRLADQFPLPVRHTGSEARADVNVNEVLANRAAQLLGQAAGHREPIDPDRDVAMGQSQASTFTACMYLSTVTEIEDAMVPRCLALIRTMERQPNPSPEHGLRLQAALARLDEAEGSLHEMGSDPGDMDWPAVVALVAADTGRPFIAAPDGLACGGSVDAMVAAMAAVRGLAIVLGDVASYLRDRWGAGAPSDAMTAACRYVIGQDQFVAEAAAGCGVSACASRPLIVASVLKSLRRLGEGCEAMRRAAARSRQAPLPGQADGFSL
jgi:fumarate hydratase class II